MNNYVDIRESDARLNAQEVRLKDFEETLKTLDARLTGLEESNLLLEQLSKNCERMLQNFASWEERLNKRDDALNDVYNRLLRYEELLMKSALKAGNAKKKRVKSSKKGKLAKKRSETKRSRKAKSLGASSKGKRGKARKSG